MLNFGELQKKLKYFQVLILDIFHFYADNPGLFEPVVTAGLFAPEQGTVL